MTHQALASVWPMSLVYGFWRQAYAFLLDRLMRGAHSMMWWSLFGLLSSSCCALQLVLNLFNFGCAGFNTYLGPLRPAFLAITITLQFRMWQLAVPNLSLPSTPDHYLPSLIISTAMTLFLSVLPELMDLKNKRSTMLHKEASGSVAAHAGPLMEVVLSLEGLGCVACTSAVLGAISKVTDNKVVVDSKVALEEKEACITLACDEVVARDSIVPDLIARIEDAGFEAELKSISTSNAPSGDSAVVVNGGSVLSASGEFASAVAGGLLSSSCCLLQLGVNLLATLDLVHIGCTGLNKVLGPWRLHLRTLMFAWLSFLWFRALRAGSCCKGLRRRLLINTAICLALTFLPELLRWSGGPALAPPTIGAKVLKLKVDGMGCEACEAHIRNVFDRSSGVIGSRADFKSGTAEVEIAEDWNFDITQTLRKLKEDGYEVEVAVEEPKPKMVTKTKPKPKPKR